MVVEGVAWVQLISNICFPWLILSAEPLDHKDSSMMYLSNFKIL